MRVRWAAHVARMGEGRKRDKYIQDFGGKETTKKIKM
jgi:hypothetical protein